MLQNTETVAWLVTVLKVRGGYDLTMSFIMNHLQGQGHSLPAVQYLCYSTTLSKENDFIKTILSNLVWPSFKFNVVTCVTYVHVNRMIHVSGVYINGAAVRDKLPSDKRHKNNKTQ